MRSCGRRPASNPSTASRRWIGRSRSSWGRRVGISCGGSATCDPFPRGNGEVAPAWRSSAFRGRTAHNWSRSSTDRAEAARRTESGSRRAGARILPASQSGGVFSAQPAQCRQRPCRPARVALDCDQAEIAVPLDTPAARLPPQPCRGGLGSRRRSPSYLVALRRNAARLARDRRKAGGHRLVLLRQPLVAASENSGEPAMLPSPSPQRADHDSVLQQPRSGGRRGADGTRVVPDGVRRNSERPPDFPKDAEKRAFSQAAEAQSKDPDKLLLPRGVKLPSRHFGPSLRRSRTTSML